MSKIHILVFIQLAALMGLLILTVWGSGTSRYAIRRVSDGPFEINPSFNGKNVVKMSLVVSILAIITSYLIIFLHYSNVAQWIVLIITFCNGVLVFRMMKKFDRYVKMINSIYDSLSEKEKARYRELEDE